ncbi:TonB-dependent receptor domain-containing protein [Bacteroides sp.]|uniref:TonB-dependent receptor domain-containing protein n=1 Tax=Bacteroides sp. TaxID=29523 RepID=UPI003D104CBF
MRLTDLLENNGYYFRKMKFCKLKTFLLTILFGSISTGILAQTNKLSIHKKETPIIQVLNELEKKSNYVFFFSDDVKTELTRRVTISATEKPLKQILDEILNRTTLTYKINDRQVTINRRDEKMPAKQNRVAKNVRFKGSVKDAESSMPLMNVNIYIPELGIGTSTDENGLFSIVLPTGNYSCRMSYIGYGTHTEKINIRQETQQEFMLQSDTKLDEVVVLANKKDENVSRTNMGVEKLTMNEIKRMPALMGEVDVIKAIQLLPGVQATAEGGSGYSVRGGSADQNLIVLDNATVYNASHMFGFFSVFNNDVVDNVELYKGDLPMKYGGRLSSLLDVQLKDTYTDKLKGSGGIGLISSRLMLEGSMGERTNWLIGGRRSYADLFLKASSDESLNKSVIYFYDINAKISHRLSNKDKLSLNLYMGNDKFGAASVAEFSYGNRVGSLTWGHVFNESLISKISLNASNYHYMLQSKLDKASIKWEAGITDLMFRWDWNQTLNRNLKLTYGATSTLHHFNPGFITQPDYPDFRIPKNKALEHGVYLSAEQKFTDKFTIRYGLRWSFFQNLGSATVYSYDNNYEVADSTQYGSGKIYHTYHALEPRIGMVYKLSETSSVKANYARNTQFIQLANNSSAGSPLDLWFPAGPNIKPQTVDMLSAGYFRNFNENNIETSVEVYYKKMNHVIDFADHAQLLLNDKLDGEIRSGKGKAYGIEFMVKKNNGPLTGFINYTLSRSERTIPEINEGKTYLSPFDKTHSINISAAYQLSKKWSVSAAWIYATGNPTSYPTGRFEINGEYFPIYSGRNEYRKKDYHRLDLSVNYVPTHKPGKKWQGEWNFSLYNAYGHKNPWIITYDQNTASGIPNAEMTYLFSMVPSITYNFKF